MSKKTCNFGICTALIQNGQRKCKLCVTEKSSNSGFQLCSIHFKPKLKKTPISPSIIKQTETTNKVEIICSHINVISAFQKLAESSANFFLVQLFDLKTQTENYYKFLQDLKLKGINETKIDAFVEKEIKINDYEKNKQYSYFTFLHQFTFFQGYQKIVVLTSLKEEINVFLGVFPLVSDLKQNEFLKRSIPPQECQEKCEILTIVCPPQNLPLASKFCNSIFSLTKLDLAVFYFYPFEDGPNNNIVEFDHPVLTSYTIYKTLMDSGFFQNISKYNKYGIPSIHNINEHIITEKEGCTL